MKATNNNSLMVQGNDSITSVNEASYLFGAYVCRELERIGMRYSYRHVMKPLMENDSLTQLELVKITNLKAPTISITLRNMEREGIVRREKNDNDRRETHVYITDKGRKMYEKILVALDKAEDTMLQGVSEKELKALRSTLEKMSDNLRSEIERV
ncbi:MAG: MarR family transcriptional regulator [Lachnospiraceae bacterium]|nr:MarR family transcriptional regulator [Ruminococcus sp.]MCM1274580.1 MarR family transcriptional regulator [Lachnospiraceae bacterium]